ncbi:type I restriction-modification system endonuclease [Acetobacterium woodii]|uniref:Type I restriction-modification system restriction subunit HsdR3 n=1 Tax=Acetobacterium woodii (strain ATCC 29683 / DSM 1030 / JCM 2381 / KCTC 1655 / WB1) TaxID=931626 RepID=H6LII9_ACEWD|nr:type I restriction-modification system endonuclease [Acetobacterium woodii]AFA48563.1 type I restriction-modification system restriction subunit HsdR3 [Acetobacterium woodii DSM 1030]
MKSNFEFLNEKFPELTLLGSLAEDYLYSDVNSCLIKLGLFGETIVNLMLEMDGLTPPKYDNTHANRLRLLKREGLIQPAVDDLFFALRKARNKAVHEGYANFNDALILLKLTYGLGVWFMQTYGNWTEQPAIFEVPMNHSNSLEHEGSRNKKEQELVTLRNEATPVATDHVLNYAERLQQSALAAKQLDLCEKETRFMVDGQLQKVGWEADSLTLNYANGTRPQKGRNLAIAKWPTNKNETARGMVDYALFVGLFFVAIVEVQCNIQDAASLIESLCEYSAENISDIPRESRINRWDRYKAPLLFATNGIQIRGATETQAGIWFKDIRNPFNPKKALQGWMSPISILELLANDIVTANAELEELVYDFLREKDGLNLRNYQVSAIQAAEKAIIYGQKRVLLSMATGTGKTRTLLGLIYRFLKTGRFRRILFLVDSSSLGEQTKNIFKEMRLEDLMTLDEIYSIKTLDGDDHDLATKIHIGSVQELVKRIIYNEEVVKPSVTDYDLIVIDEAHRGFVLNTKMEDNEQLYKNRRDYIRKYAQILDYFHATIVAMTATPAQHTSALFGRPVFHYSYSEAVIDGFLVDHNPPQEMDTTLAWQALIDAQLIVPVRPENVTNWDELTDELGFEVESINRHITPQSFTVKVINEIALYLEPQGNGKTLIFAVDEYHADNIVANLRKIYEPLGFDPDVVMKLSRDVSAKNRNLSSKTIKQFQNEKFPRIAVTADYHANEINVPEITKLVFMSWIDSRILFEQMLGKATRRCPAIGKTHFDIYDPVGFYQAFKAFINIGPVINNAISDFSGQLNQLDKLESEDDVKITIEQIIVMLHRQKSNFDEQTLRHFSDLTAGLSPDQFIENIQEMTIKEAQNYLLGQQKLFALLDHDGLQLFKKEDSKNIVAKRYLEEFKHYLINHDNQNEIIDCICKRPEQLTRTDLKRLTLELERNDFTEDRLNHAWQDVTGERRRLDLIGLIRQQILGLDELSHIKRIKKAVNNLKKNHDFNQEQLKWINRIENNILFETVLDRDIFTVGAFKKAGGFFKIDQLFKNNLDQLLNELKNDLYFKGGTDDHENE